MANASTSAHLDLRSDAPVSKAFKCCKNKCSSVKVCVKCGEIFHPSCGERFNLKAIDSTRVICCDSEGSSSKLKKDTDLSYEVEILKKDRDYLQLLLAQVEDKNKLLFENKCLLNEKLECLEKEILNYKHDYHRCFDKPDKKQSDTEGRTVRNSDDLPLSDVKKTVNKGNSKTNRKPQQNTQLISSRNSREVTECVEAGACSNIPVKQAGDGGAGDAANVDPSLSSEGYLKVARKGPPTEWTSF